MYLVLEVPRTISLNMVFFLCYTNIEQCGFPPFPCCSFLCYNVLSGKTHLCVIALTLCDDVRFFYAILCIDTIFDCAIIYMNTGCPNG